MDIERRVQVQDKFITFTYGHYPCERYEPVSYPHRLWIKNQDRMKPRDLFGKQTIVENRGKSTAWILLLSASWNENIPPPPKKRKDQECKGQNVQCPFRAWLILAHHNFLSLQSLSNFLDFLAFLPRPFRHPFIKCGQRGGPLTPNVFDISIFYKSFLLH